MALPIIPMQSGKAGVRVAWMLNGVIKQPAEGTTGPFGRSRFRLCRVPFSPRVSPMR